MILFVAGGQKTGILEETITKLEQEGPLEIQDPADTNFFVSAMDICRNHLGDTDLAKRIHKLLHAHDNYDLIGRISILFS
jgi:pentatricopeptide repeat domain-containing protein 3